MKKNNIIMYLLAFVVSIFLLWLWYYLGLNQIDQPLDLVISIIWWIMMIIAVVVIVRVEQRRKEQIRSVYVSDDILFNSELGSRNYEGLHELVTSVETILGELEYSFKKNDMPNTYAFSMRAIIKTRAYKKDETWKGSLVLVGRRQAQEFASKEALVACIKLYELENQPRENSPLSP